MYQIETPDTPMKRCSRCKEEFPATHEYFPRDKNKRDGLSYTCRACRLNYDREYYRQNRSNLLDQVHQHYHAHREQILKQKQEYYQENRGSILNRQRKYREVNKDIIRERRRTHYQTNRQRILEAKHESYLKNREHFVELRRKSRQSRKAEGHDYYKNNRDAFRVRRHNRRARELGLPNTFSNEDWRRSLKYFAGCCAVCGSSPNEKRTLAADHWIPLSSPDCPGTITTNMVPLCHGVDGCNNSKRNKHPQAWLMERFGQIEAARILERIEAYFEYARALKQGGV